MPTWRVSFEYDFIFRAKYRTVYCDPNFTSDAYKESLPENKQFIEENKKETLAQVFTDVRYTKKDNEFMSENLLKVLRQQGFLK